MESDRELDVRRARARVRALAAAGGGHLRKRARMVWPPIGFVRFASLRRLTPIAQEFGAERGTPLDRYYIDDFLERHSGRSGWVTGDVRGRVLEVGDDAYARTFGSWGSSESAVERVDILHGDTSNPRATVVADLAAPTAFQEDAYDCVICTQTLNLVYDVRSAVETLHRILAPGGVVLVTVPGISQKVRPYADLDGDYWRFTARSGRRLFEEFFPPEAVSVQTYGNVLSSIAFLHGLAAEDLRRDELDAHDPDYELLIAVRARKEG